MTLRSLLRIAVLVLAGAAWRRPGLPRRTPSVPVPANVTAEGLPPIPAAIATRLAPYGQFRRAQLLSWHATRREMLVTTTTDKVMQVHAVAAPGAAPKALTDVAGGVTVAAAYSPRRRRLVRLPQGSRCARDAPALAAERRCSRRCILTDGTSRNGTPAWSPKSGRIAFDSNKRNGKDRDIYVMDPKDPATMRMLVEVSGSWYVAAWSPDDTQHHRGRDAAGQQHRARGRSTCERQADAAHRATTFRRSGRRSSTRPDGRAIYAVSNRESEFAARVAAPHGHVDGADEGRRLGRSRPPSRRTARRSRWCSIATPPAGSSCSTRGR